MRLNFIKPLKVEFISERTVAVKNYKMCLSLILISFSASLTATAEDCSREWAVSSVKNSSFKVIGLGLSSNSDPKIAADEAKTSAIKDIVSQLESNVQSKTEVKRSESSSSFESESIISTKMEDLKGLKPVKHSKNSEQKISRCDVYEFNVRAAHQELASKLGVLIERLERFEESHKLTKLFIELPKLKKEVQNRQAEVQRADTFKTYLETPGPSWEEQIQRKISALEELEKTSKSKLVFILPDNADLESVLGETENALSNAGLKVVKQGDEISDESIPVFIEVKILGKNRKSKTKLGLTVTRKAKIRLINQKTKKVLAANRGLSIIGTSADGNEEDAIANSDAQLVAAALDTIKSFVPGLLKN